MKTERGGLANYSYNLYLLDAVGCWMEGTFYYSTSGNLGHRTPSPGGFCNNVTEFMNREKIHQEQPAI